MKAFTLIAASFMVTSACLADCKPGEKQLRAGEICIPAGMADYLYCLQNSGGGTVEIVHKGSDTQSNDLQITLGGKASGIVIRGDANGSVSNKSSKVATDELQAKLDPGLAGTCKAFADKVPTVTADDSARVEFRYENMSGGKTIHGRFFNKVPKYWSETSDDPGGQQLNFQEISSDQNWIVLHDDGRNVELRLPSAGGMAQWHLIGEARWNNLYIVERIH